VQDGPRRHAGQTARQPDRRRERDFAHAPDVGRAVNLDAGLQRANPELAEGVQLIAVRSDADRFPGVDKGAVRHGLVVVGGHLGVLDGPGVGHRIRQALLRVPEGQPHQAAAALDREGSRRIFAALVRRDAQERPRSRSLGSRIAAQRHAFAHDDARCDAVRAGCREHRSAAALRHPVDRGLQERRGISVGCGGRCQCLFGNH